jgi:hypothetical protein
MLVAGVPASLTLAVGAGEGEVGAGVVVGAVVDAGVVDAGAAAVLSVAGDTPTPLPQAASSSPEITKADSENAVLRGLIVSMGRLKYGRLLGAICRRLRT